MSTMGSNTRTITDEDKPESLATSIVASPRLFPVTEMLVLSGVTVTQPSEQEVVNVSLLPSDLLADTEMVLVSWTSMETTWYSSMRPFSSTFPPSLPFSNRKRSHPASESSSAPAHNRITHFFMGITSYNLSIIEVIIGLSFLLLGGKNKVSISVVHTDKVQILYLHHTLTST